LHPNWGTGRDKPTGNTKGVKKMRKITGNKKGIQTILAALLMVVIVVVAAVMVYAWATGLLGTLLVHPTTGQENLAYVTNSATFSGNNMNLTAYINNIGSANVTLHNYYVKDPNGNEYSYTYSSGPTISPNHTVAISFPIGSLCPAPGCTLTGSAFTFQSGYQYTVLMITTHNNQFTFQAIR
jgi:FlaG/FlaF family flagellin (archaellin)